MLRELRIKDFAIIDVLTVEFESGLNVLTGETGAGKSIVIDALGLTLGERAQSDMVRAGRSEALVEAFFDISRHPMLERLGIPSEEGIILRRVLSSSGKSRAYINDTMVNVQTLLELGRTLVDIHGQHEHQSLLSSENQRSLLDAYGKLLHEGIVIDRLFHEVQVMKQELSFLASNVKEREQRIDLLRFQINEIEASSLKPGEREALEEERAILANTAKLVELTGSAYSLLYSGNDSLAEKLSSVISMVKEVSKIDSSVREVLELLESSKPLLDDAAASLRSCRDRYDLNPDRLDAAEERLDLIKRLERKYGEGIEGILEYRQKAEKELQELTVSDEQLKEKQETLTSREAELSEKARRLTVMRKKVAGRIEGAVKPILRELAMDKAEFAVAVKTGPLTSTGMDTVEFLFSANEGEPVRQLGRVASGGELSRIMLALKETLAEVDKVPVLIFDEVDAGIGGRTAEYVGMRLKSLSKNHQVLCITHLPQIAAMADRHMTIEKLTKKDGICVRVKETSREEREEEIARMLSGKITDISLKHARELLGRRG